MNGTLKVLLVLAVATGVHGKKRAAKEDGLDRLRVEMDADGAAAPSKGQSAEMAGKEAEAVEGLEPGLKDVLIDIMAVLQHGSEPSKDQAIGQLVNVALHTSEQGQEQARRFRSAVVAGGALPALITVLQSSDPARQLLVAKAIHALAIDDPTTDSDNFHAEEICQHGGAPRYGPAAGRRGAPDGLATRTHRLCPRCAQLCPSLSSFCSRR